MNIFRWFGPSSPLGPLGAGVLLGVVIWIPLFIWFWTQPPIQRERLGTKLDRIELLLQEIRDTLQEPR